MLPTTDDLCARVRAVRTESKRLVEQAGRLGGKVDRSPKTRRDGPPPAPFPVVALAASAGGLLPLLKTLVALPEGFPAAVIVLLHRAPPSRLHEFLDERIALPVDEAADGDLLQPGQVLVAPTGVQMTVDRTGRVALCDGPVVNFTRPAADVLFASLAAGFAERVAVVVFSGTGRDGALGTAAVQRAGGFVIAQDSASAEYTDMPIAAVDQGKVDLVLRPEQIASALRFYHLRQ